MYTDVDNAYAADAARARAKGYHRKEADYEKKRKLNDQAYFLFMFTRLEDRIRKLSEIVFIRKSDKLTNYKNQRAWDMIRQRGNRAHLDLLERVSFLTQYNGPDYHIIVGYKRLRDNIAHGEEIDEVDMTAVINNMTRFYRDLIN
jgi:hypothetical protein